MKKGIGLIFSTGLIAGLLSIAACSDDPPPKRNLSFAESVVAFNEADGIIEIEVILDKPALEDVTIDYELDGTATDNEVDPNFSDYIIVEDDNDYGEVEIIKGETVGVIQIEIYSDFDFEDTETIEISLIGTDSEKVLLTREDEIEVSIEQEDGLAIVLDWEYTNVDMDLFLWATDGGTLQLTNFGSASASLQGPEFIFLPNVVDDGQYGITCNYYEGPENLDPMNFIVDFITIVNSDDVNTVTKNGAYKPVNRNPWDTSTGTDLLLAATYTKAGSTYSNFSNITVHPSGSRSVGTLNNLNLKKGLKGGVFKGKF